MNKLLKRNRILAAGLALTLVTASACSSDGSDGAAESTSTTSVDGATSAPDGDGASVELSDDDTLAVATTHADLAFANYDAAVTSAGAVQAAVDAFVADPTAETLEAAKQQWLDARDVYGPTEVFRFSDGPIDDADDGPEGQINAWPMDEAYVDYVTDDPEAGIINDVEGVPEITTDVLVEANEDGGETNISTGWHAIEFLLWGQDESDEGPGERPVTDYTTAENAERRGTYLTLLADLLVEDLSGVRDQWDPEGGAYRETFLADPDQAIADMLRGMGALSAGELAGERMAVPYETKAQEDEHSCFSDNTIADIVNNAKGIQMAYTADFEGVEGTSLSDVLGDADPDLDAELTDQLAANVAGAEALNGPFDQLIAGPDEGPDREALLELIESLQAQGDAVASLASSMGYDISIEV